MATKTLTGCANNGNVSLERNNFFAGQLVTPADFTQEQRYFRDAQRRHNRLLHGWGVVCGAWVTPAEEPGHVCVEAGYLLGPQGDEIVIDAPVLVDLYQVDPDGNAVSACGQAGDIWCSDVRADLPANEPVYLAVRYDECLTRPVQVPLRDCGNGDMNCEYSRVRSSFTIKVLTELPDTYTDPLQQPDIGSAVQCRPNSEDPYRRNCPPCPSAPWVILAKIRLPADGELSEENIDNVSLRRFVASFANYYFICGDRERGERVVEERPAGTVRPAGVVGMVAQPAGTSARLAERAYEAVLTEEARRRIAEEFGGDRAAIGEMMVRDLEGFDPESPVMAALGDVPIRAVLEQDRTELLLNVMRATPEASTETVAADAERLLSRVNEAGDVMNYFAGSGRVF